MNTETLRRLQETELSILLEVDEFCKLHDIQYSLYGGTALGAVRHAGFIPWDDDMDIVMTRSSFNKFCDCWKEHPIEGLFLQNASIDITCGINHTKIRKDDTLFLSRGMAPNRTHAGIWIDILVWDKVPNTKRGTLYIYWNLVRSFVFSRGYTLNSTEKRARHIAKRILRMIPESWCKRQMRRATLNFQRYDDWRSNYSWMCLACMQTIRKGERFPAHIAENCTEIDFEGVPLRIFADYEKMLEVTFGDYMKLPPEEQRVCTHNPVRIEFERREGERV